MKIGPGSAFAIGIVLAEMIFLPLGQLGGKAIVRNELRPIVAIVQLVNLTPAEQATYQAALAKSAVGDNSQLDNWVSSLAKKGKYGVLPAIPASFSRSDIIRVDDKAILVKGASK